MPIWGGVAELWTILLLFAVVSVPVFTGVVVLLNRATGRDGRESDLERRVEQLERRVEALESDGDSGD